MESKIFSRSMGSSSSKNAITYENLRALEFSLFKLSGLPVDQIEQRDVRAGEFQGKPVYIRTLLCGDPAEGKPKIVIVHGFGCTGATFFKLVEPLTAKFFVILIDIVGMGASCRPGDYPHKTITAEESVEYFTGYFERWRLSMGAITNFFVLAHSLGGYLMGQYALKYKEHIRKIVFISPIGMTSHGPEYVPAEHWDDIFTLGTDNLPPLARQIYRWSFEKKVSFFALMRVIGQRAGSAIIRKYIDPYMQNYTEADRQLCINYLLQVHLRKPCTELALFNLFDMSLSAKIPLGTPDKLANPEFPIAMSFIYGKDDWVYQMDGQGGKTVIEANQFPSSKMYIIPDANHQPQFENALATAHVILNDVFGAEEGWEELPVPSLKQQHLDMLQISDYSSNLKSFMDEMVERRNNQHAVKHDQIDPHADDDLLAYLDTIEHEVEFDDEAVF